MPQADVKWLAAKPSLKRAMVALRTDEKTVYLGWRLLADDPAGRVFNVYRSTAGGAPVRLGDVAEVRIGHPPPIGDAVINDGPGLLLIVEKQPWGNTLEVTAGVEKVLAETNLSDDTQEFRTIAPQPDLINATIFFADDSLVAL